MNGTVTYQHFGLIKNNPTLEQSLNEVIATNECCYVLPALAEYEKTNELKNDYHSVYFRFDDGYLGAELVLQKDGIDLVSLDNNDLGTFYEYGFYTTIYNEKTIGYNLDWSLVLNEYGEGDYRIKCIASLLDATEQNLYSFEFCLKEYSDTLADETVRLDFIKNGNSGDWLNIRRKVDYGNLNWSNSIRIANAFFGKESTELTKEFTRYQNGQNVWIKDELEFELTLSIFNFPNYIKEFILKEVNVNSELYITDYNLVNHNTYLKFPIVATSGTKPTYESQVKLISNADFTYKYAINNFINSRC